MSHCDFGCLVLFAAVLLGLPEFGTISAQVEEAWSASDDSPDAGSSADMAVIAAGNLYVAEESQGDCAVTVHGFGGRPSWTARHDGGGCDVPAVRPPEIPARVFGEGMSTRREGLQ